MPKRRKNPGLQAPPARFECPVCQSPYFQIVCRPSFYRCRKCGFGFTHPELFTRPAADERRDEPRPRALKRHMAM